jgi:hypothetical protein
VTVLRKPFAERELVDMVTTELASHLERKRQGSRDACSGRGMPCLRAGVSGLLTWLRSTLRGEVPTGDLYARRGAGTAAYSLAEEAAGVEGDDRGTCLFRVCAWNAFALQTIAETMLDVDAEDDPGTAGYVPPATMHFAGDCIDCVPDWIRLARIVQTDPEARVRSLPATLPPWSGGRPTRRSELHGLRTAYEALEARVETDLQKLGPPTPPAAIAQIRRLRAEMTSSAEYAYAIALGKAGAVDRGEARWRLLSALEDAFLLGQLLALPSLVEIARSRDPNGSESGLTDTTSWLAVRPGWPVIDADGMKVGLVLRVLGDRDTGAFDGVEVASGIETATLHVPTSAVGTIAAGEIKLSIRGAELGP